MPFNWLLKIVNSAVCVGLYYGLINTLSIRLSFFLLFVDEPEKRLAVINGLILAQLVRFLAIYNAPLHRLLCIPHAIAAFFIPYLWFYFLLDNFHPSFTISESSTFSLFLNSFIFQLSNQMIFPSSLFGRLGHIYLFRCKNKLDFLTGSFVGWSIGQILLFLFLQRLCALIYKYRLRSDQNKLVAKWNKSITKYLGEEFMAFLAQRVSEFFKYCNKYSNKIYEYLAKHLGYEFTYIVRDCEWFVSEMQYLLLVELMRNRGRLITIFLFVLVLGDSARRQVPQKQLCSFERDGIQTMTPDNLKRQIQNSYALIGVENNPIGLDPNPTTTNKKTKMELEERTPSSKDLEDWQDLKDRRVDQWDVFLNGGEVENKLAKEMCIEQNALNVFSDQDWVRPLRYIRNTLFTAAPQECDSQYFFDTCRSDGKERIAFTYLPALSFVKEILKTIRISSSTVEKPSFDKLDKNWLKKNNKKKKNLNNELKKRIEALDAGFLFRDLLEKRTRVCTDKTEKTCPPTNLDPLLTGPRRRRIKELALDFTIPEADIKKSQKEQISETSEPISETSETIQLGETTIKVMPRSNLIKDLAAEDPIITVNPVDALFEDLKNELKQEWNNKIYKEKREPENKTDKARRRKKILTRLYGKDLESQARRRKKSKTLKSRGRKILGPSQPKRRKFMDVNHIIDTLIPGYQPQSPKYELTRQELVTREQLRKKKFHSNLFFKLFHVKRDWKKQKKKNEKLMKFEQELLNAKVGKKVARWRFLLVTQLEKVLNLHIHNEIIPHKPEHDDDEHDFEIFSRDFREINDEEGMGPKKKKETEIDEDGSSASKAKKEIGTQKNDNKIDANTQKNDNEIDANTQKNDNEIDANTQQNDNEIDEKTQKNDKKTKTQKTEEEIEEEILNTHPIFTQTETESGKIELEWTLLFTNQRSPEADTIKGSTMPLRRKRISLRWVDSFLHSPVFYPFRTSRLDIYFKFSHVKGLVKKFIDRFKSKKESKKESKKGKKRKEREKRKEGGELDRLRRKLLRASKNLLKRIPWQQQTESRAANPEHRAEHDLWTGIYIWEESLDNGLAIRSLFLVFFSRFRKYVALPSVIILKNLGRLLLAQKPEWSEDFEDWQAEVHIITNHQGININEATLWNWPEEWWDDGFQIKVLRPLSLRPWHLKGDQQEIMSEYNKKYHELYIMPGAWTLAAHPFGLPVKQKSLELFFSPIWDKLKPIVDPFLIFLRGSSTFFLVLIKGIIKFLIKWIKVIIKFLIKCIKVIIKFLIKCIKVIIKLIMKCMKVIIKWNKDRRKRVDESSETKKEKDSLISNEIIQESFSQIQSTALPNSEEQIQNLIDRTNTIKKKIEIIRKEKIKLTPGLNKNGESPKNIWKSVKRRTVRLRNQFHSFQNCLIEKIYQICLDIVLCIIKKILAKAHPEITQKRSFTKNFLKLFFSPDLSSLSQVYVFSKLAQSQISDKLRSVLKYRGTSFFLKTAIKESFERQGIFHSELKNKKLRNFRTNPWKNWLRGLPHYTLSKRRWSELKARCKKATLLKYLKSFNYFNRHRPKKKEQNVDSLKKKKKNLETNKLEKNYRYDLLAYKFLSAETKKECYISKQKDGVSNIPGGMFMKYYMNYLPKKANLFESKIFNIFEIDFMAGIDSYLTDNYVTDPIWMKPYPSSIPSIPPIPKRCVSALEMQSEPTITEKRDNEKRDSEKRYEAFLLGLDEAEGDLDLPRVNSTDEEWFVRQVWEPWTRYRKARWVLPSQQLFKNLDGNIKMVGEEEYQIAEEDDKLKKEMKLQKKIRKAKKKKKIRKEQLKNESQVEESDDSQEIFLTSQDIFTNQYEKYEKKVKKQRKKKTDRTPSWSWETKYLVPFTEVETDSFSVPEDPVLKWLLQRKVRLTISPRSIFVKFWGRGESTVTNSILSTGCYRIRSHWLQKGLLVLKPSSNMFIKNQEELILYQVISISLDHKRKLETQDNFDLLVPEMILSSRRRRELRILNSLNFNFKNRNGVDINRVFGKENTIKSSGQFLDESKDVDRDKNEFIKLKFFLWPNFRLEDLACMNRYWFDTSNGSRFSMLRLYMYPRFKIR